jgi:hypothetical protein
MTWGAVAVGGASLLGGILGSRSARGAAQEQSRAAEVAAQAQLQASRESNQLVRDMYQTNLGLQAPGIRTGQLALSALSSGLGLGPVQAQQQPGMGGGAPIGATQEELASAGQPFAGRLSETFKPSALTQDPSYQFRLTEGLRAIQARGAATGMLQTGQGLRDISDYGQASASQEYGSAYDRFMRNQEALYSRLSGLAGIGQQATGSATAAGAQAAQNIGQTTVAGTTAASEQLTGAAAARAAGQVGSTQAITGGLRGGASDWMTLQYLNRMPGGGSTVGAPQPAGLPLPRTIG